MGLLLASIYIQNEGNSKICYPHLAFDQQHARGIIHMINYDYIHICDICVCARVCNYFAYIL